MGREIRRVPLDFDWPLNKVWAGFLMPSELHLPTCADCKGDGYSVDAHAIANTFYPHQIGYGRDAEALAWHNKIGQAEVDNLVAEGRLRVLRRREPTADEPRDWEWVSVPRTAAEINALNTRGGMDGHDALNRHVLVRFRCERLGIPLDCPTCDGHGDIGTPEQREAVDNWNGTDPPTGDGWQVWETVSEGSPITPVFATADELIARLVQDGYNSEAAQKFVTGSGWVPSLVMAGGHFYNDIDSAALQSKA